MTSCICQFHNLTYHPEILSFEYPPTEIYLSERVKFKVMSPTEERNFSSLIQRRHVFKFTSILNNGNYLYYEMEPLT